MQNCYSKQMLSLTPPYLFVFTEDSALLSKENVNGSFVVIFQWSSHHQVIEAIAIQIRDGSQC